MGDAYRVVGFTSRFQYPAKDTNWDVSEER